MDRTRGLDRPSAWTRALVTWIAVSLVAGVLAAVTGGDDSSRVQVAADLPPVELTIPTIPPVTVPDLDLPPVSVPDVVDVEVDIEVEVPPEVAGPVVDLVGATGDPMAIDRPGLWLIDADAGSTRVLFNDLLASDVAFSPDGTGAVVLTYEGTSRHGSLPVTMWVVDLVTGLRRAIAGPTPGIYSPSWSSDGEWIAYSAPRGDDADDPSAPDGVHSVGSVWVIHPDGSGEHRVAVTDGYGGHYSWSPDGSRLTASLYNDDRVLVADVRHGTESRFAATDPAHAEWSPDGRQLAVSTNFEGPLSVMDPATGRSTVIADDLWGPVWSPDSAWIAASGDDPEDGAALVRRDGTDRRTVTSSSILDWSRDGRLLLLGGYGAGLSVFDTTTGQERVIANRPAEGLDWLGKAFVPGTHRAALLVWP